MFEIVKKFFARCQRMYSECKYDKYKNLNIGNGTQYALDNLDGIAPQLITIGAGCVIAPKAVILTHDACLLPTTGMYIFKRVHIGDRVFIGYGAVIMPGVTVGNDVVIGSNCVVTHDIPANSVVVGLPGRIICKTSELALRRQSQLTTPVFNWEKKITTQDIIRQQSVLMELFLSENK
ncbi:hypothetical protein K4H28_02520 [Deefgea tanakiae]|uniref:Uncharacterized protein n=1 Tax=Deefgea tanakiae TaxID=2865840 RepID=A0ABX8Z6Y2_9NEIS|nr:DapH/DapD/GlmU-related protein [Deefgea tanakiae]QZA78311.1 hypothetical protein K4H28_02520 [Deefgea tanakiae]